MPTLAISMLSLRLKWVRHPVAALTTPLNSLPNKDPVMLPVGIPLAAVMIPQLVARIAPNTAHPSHGARPMTSLNLPSAVPCFTRLMVKTKKKVLWHLYQSLSLPFCCSLFYPSPLSRTKSIACFLDKPSKLLLPYSIVTVHVTTHECTPTVWYWPLLFSSVKSVRVHPLSHIPL